MEEPDASVNDVEEAEVGAAALSRAQMEVARNRELVPIEQRALENLSPFDVQSG